MAEIAAFRGILYDTQKAGPAAKLLAPPYDVISTEERARLAALDAHNSVRLILPDGEGDQKYAHAAALLKTWMEEGVMRRDDKPALYRYVQTFQAPGENRTIIRKGFICRIRLHRFDEGVVLPHERTLSGPKADRLKLKRATRTHLSQVFGLYSDPARATDKPFAEVEAGKPDLEGTTSDGVHQALYRLTDPAKQKEVIALLSDKKIYIADGHHRYETMLALREELRRESNGDPNSSIEFGTIFLANMDDPGLVVFPTHRVVHGLPNFDLRATLDAAKKYFTVEEMPLGDTAKVKKDLADRGAKNPAFGLAHASGIAYLTLRTDVALPIKGPDVVKTLDVTLLHALVIEEILKIDRAAQEAQTNLRYVKDTAQALAEVKTPGVQAVFLMNPTKVTQVQAVADAGEVMPQKSTFFYPKIASGLVLNPLIPSEKV